MALDQSEAVATLDEQLDAVAPEPMSSPADIVDPPSVLAPELPNEAADEQPEAPTPAAQQPALTLDTRQPGPNVFVRMFRALMWPVAQILVLLDKPFAKLGPGLKSIIGMIAIATSAIAAATWGAALFFPFHH